MKERLRRIFPKLPPVIFNPYLIAGVLFLIWMLFLDENNLIHQYRHYRHLQDMREKKAFYESAIRKTDEELKQLTTDSATQEKFAREHYWMKRDNEDVFIIVKK